MHISLATLISLIVLGAATAHATERPPRAGETAAEHTQVASPAPARAQDPDPAAEQPTRPARAAGKHAQPPVKRRSVQMTVDGMPATAPPAVYAPTLTPQLPMPGVVSPSPVVRAPDRPVFMNSCDAGGCTGTDGMRYNGGVGTTLIGPQGKACHNNGTTVQC